MEKLHKLQSMPRGCRGNGIPGNIASRPFEQNENCKISIIVEEMGHINRARRGWLPPNLTSSSLLYALKVSI